MDKKMKEKLKKLYNFYQGSNEKLQKQIIPNKKKMDKKKNKAHQKLI
jgi:preprotein translocase subunit SecE